MDTLATVRLFDVECHLTEEGWQCPDAPYLADELNVVASLTDESLPPAADQYAWAVHLAVETMGATIVKDYPIEARKDRTY